MLKILTSQHFNVFRNYPISRNALRNIDLGRVMFSNAIPKTHAQMSR